ncbi:hypothetical protein [Candidatus Tisiphia endosymbiont of Oplodontha viridula]|uniref:hypothetical protein n=1 Tax=Candidatus Tisiphia endosymbiont of Oplodontha viridula TaxID=3077925 RepID=UPI0035C924E7
MLLLLRRLTPPRNDVWVTTFSSLRNHGSGRGNPLHLDCFVATKVAPRNDAGLFFL